MMIDHPVDEVIPLVVATRDDGRIIGLDDIHGLSFRDQHGDKRILDPDRPGFTSRVCRFADQTDIAAAGADDSRCHAL